LRAAEGRQRTSSAADWHPVEENCFTRAGLLLKDGLRYFVCHFCAGPRAGFNLISIR
jgi:hypothetical protein